MALPTAFKEQPQFGAGQFDALAAFNGLLGLRFAWGTTFGLALPDIDKALAQLSRGGSIIGVAGTAGSVNLFGDAGLSMLEQIGHGLTHTQAAAADKWVTEAWALDGIGATIERIAEDAVRTRKMIARKTEPRHAIRAVQPSVRTQIRPVAQQAAHAEDRAQAAERRARALEQRVAQLERTLTKPHSVAIPGLLPRVGGIERELDRLKGRVGKLGKYAGLAAFVALLAKALEKMGVNYIRCGNVKNVGRRLCGMDSSILDTLLASTALIIGTVSIYEFAEGMQGILGEIEGPARRFWRSGSHVVPDNLFGQ